MEKLILIVSVIGFTSACISFVADHSLSTWCIALLNVFLMFFWATQIKRKSYSWLCAYETNEGSGRIFITSGTKKLSKDLVLGIEEYLRNENDCSHCHLVNLQFMGEAT